MVSAVLPTKTRIPFDFSLVALFSHALHSCRCRSKGFDYACPIGPALVSPKLFERNATAPLVRVTGRLNGKTRQDAPTSNLVFSVAKIISFLSKGTTLERGSIILTGTPAGVGTFDKPMTFLRDGDVFEVRRRGHWACRCGICSHVALSRRLSAREASERSAIPSSTSEMTDYLFKSLESSMTSTLASSCRCFVL